MKTDKNKKKTQTINAHIPVSGVSSKMFIRQLFETGVFCGWLFEYT